MRALLVTTGLLAVTGIATAAAQPPTTIVRSPSPVAAVAQDGDMLAWFTSNRTRCNAVRMMGGGQTYVLPQPLTGTLTCNWNLTAGVQRLAIAADTPAALWTLRERGSDFVMTAEAGGKEVKVERLAHQSDGTGWWLGGLAGGGTILAYSSVNVAYVDPFACASGGSCAKKIADGGIELVSAGQKTPLFSSAPALGLALSSGRIAYIRATTVTKGGTPVSSANAAVEIHDVSDGTIVSEANPVGVPLAVGLSSHVLAVISRASGKKKLTWYDAATGAKLGGITVPATTSPALAMDDQLIVYRVGEYLRGLVIATGRGHVLAQTALGAVGLSLEAGRLVWAESSRTSGRIRALSVP